MTADVAVTCVAGALAGGTVAAVLVRLRLKAPPLRAMRTNVHGRPVPVVLGGPLTVASLTALALVSLGGSLGWGPGRTGATGAAVALVVVVMNVAGGSDDRRGDEADRGFSGHLKAARSGGVTGGVVKLVAGGLAGLAAGALTTSGGGIVVVAASTALGANFLNLTDRAPGRAGKVFLLLGVPLIVLGDSDWAVAASCTVGAELGCLGADLRERAMLGDAGSNPLGAVAGLGLALSLPGGWAVVAAVLLLAANVASERWSFSDAIERVKWLSALDQMGRK